MKPKIHNHYLYSIDDDGNSYDFEIKENEYELLQIFGFKEEFDYTLQYELQSQNVYKIRIYFDEIPSFLKERLSKLCPFECVDIIRKETIWW